MGWVQPTREASTHVCARPSGRPEHDGSLWECEECGRVWRFSWRRVTLAEALRTGSSQTDSGPVWQLVDAPRLRLLGPSTSGPPGA